MMSIKLPDRKTASPEIGAFEKRVGQELPRDYVRFLKKHDGVRPPDNCFRLSKNIACGVSRFIPLRQVLSTREKYLSDLQPHVIPVARAEGGNWVLLELGPRGKVLFLDHELREQRFVLAKSFQAFLAKLQPFDASNIKLDPKQVISVWVDPEFLTQLREQQG